jgi:DNA polymerase-3 subunit epsilon
MREVVLDTETTGLDPNAGHRVVEIGCVELVNHVATGRVFHRYVNPERPMPVEAFAIHGLSDAFLSTHPTFAETADPFLDFIGTAPLVIHNADFDMKFLNWELVQLGQPVLPRDRAIDTVGMARRKFPGSPASLDALCKRFAIDNSARDKHGALLDAELLADVYLELIGGREPGLALGRAGVSGDHPGTTAVSRPFRAPRAHAPTAEERAVHGAFLGKLTQPLWQSE